MPLLGKAAVAMWWNIRAEMRSEFGDWHSHEHFPERLGIPGFRRGSRWSSTLDATGFFVLYELDDYATLTSAAYLARLNDPTPWSRKMMPHHLDMVRSQCRVVAGFGGGVAGAIATIRLSPRAGTEEPFGTTLVETLEKCSGQAGLAGAHLLRTDTPKTAAPTTEQQIRRGDAAADWIILVSGYEPEAVAEALAASLSPAALHAMGARESLTVGRYQLSLAMTAQDVGASA